MAKTDGPKVSIKLHQTSDRELWIVSMENWALPVFSEPFQIQEDGTNVRVLTPAVAFYPKQTTLMNGLLGPHAMTKERSRWIIKESAIAGLPMQKAPGITPRWYYKWPEEGYPPMPLSTVNGDINLAEKKGSWDFERFVEHVSQAYSIPVTMIRILLRAISAEAPRWMLKTMRPLDLGFVRLAALPFRPNWKQIVLAKLDFRRLRKVFSLHERDLNKALEACKLPETLCSPDNIAWYHHGSTLSYTIEAIPSKHWEAIVFEVESERAAKGQVKYVDLFETVVETMYYHAADALRSYVQKVSMPYCGILPCGPPGSFRFRTRYRMVYDDRIGVGGPTYIIPPVSGFSVAAEQSHIEAVQKTPLDLSSMPTIQLGPEDVRGCKNGSNVDKPDDGKEKTDGVPVLDASQGDAEGQSVLLG